MSADDSASGRNAGRPGPDHQPPRHLQLHHGR